VKQLLDHSLTVSALRWMLLVQVACLALHITLIPLSLTSILVFCVLWRLQVIRGRWRFPNRYIKVMLATLGLIILVTSFQKLSVSAAVSFLLLAYGLKLIELHSRRDAYISLFLSFLVAAIVFLFETSLLVASLVLSVCIAITCALIAMHSKKSQSIYSLVKQSSVYWLSAIPLMLVFFVFFPRMAPLWSLDLGQSSRTGLTDNISPGDIAKLTQSDELVFRARFFSDLPMQPEGMYWRAFVLDYTDGRGWKRSEAVDYIGNLIDWYGEPASKWQQQMTSEGPYYDYEVILEPTHQPWLFSLDGSLPEQAHLGLTQDFTLQYDKPVRQTIRYSSKMPSLVSREPRLAQWRAGRELQLPENENPKTRALAQRLWQETQDVALFVNRVLEYFIENQFSYTLRPPLLGEKANDEFLFETRKGFCAHYAGALVTIARYAGVPARVVGGYLGGEWNEQAKYVTVRQYDAHAWTEIWVPGKGWTLVDPTSVVAPDRVASGLAEAMREEGSFLEDSLLSPHRYQGIAVLDSVREMIDSINYQWSLRVVGFDVKKQTGIFSEMTSQWGRYTWLVVAGLILVSLFIPFLLWGIYVLFKRLNQRRTPKEKFEIALMGILRKYLIGNKTATRSLTNKDARTQKTNYAEMNVRKEAGVTIVPNGVTPNDLFLQLLECYPQKDQQIEWLAKRYESLCYGELSDGNPKDKDKQWQFMLKQLLQLKAN